MQNTQIFRATFLCSILIVGLTIVKVRGSAETKLNLSTPRDAAALFVAGIEDGNFDWLKAASVGGTDADYAILKSLSDMIQSEKRLGAAMRRKFGEDAFAFSNFSRVMYMSIGMSTEKIDGNTATLVTARPTIDKNPPTLRKIGDEWKLDITVLRSDPNFAKIGENSAKLAALFDARTKDVDAGKYATYQDALLAVHPADRRLLH